MASNKKSSGSEMSAFLSLFQVPQDESCLTTHGVKFHDICDLNLTSLKFLTRYML